MTLTCIMVTKHRKMILTDVSDTIHADSLALFALNIEILLADVTKPQKSKIWLWPDLWRHQWPPGSNVWPCTGSSRTGLSNGVLNLEIGKSSSLGDLRRGPLAPPRRTCYYPDPSGARVNQTLYLYPVPIWIQKRYFIFTCISQYARPCWRSSPASARHSRHQPLQHTTWCCAMPSSAASPAHGGGGKCWRWREVSSCWPCLAGSPGDFRLGWDPGCFLATLLSPEDGEFLSRLSGRVRRSSVLHEDDMAGADSQRALNNPPLCR